MTKKSISDGTVEVATATFVPPAFAECARKVFGSHSEAVGELHFTADGTCFTERQQAADHATNLGAEHITTIKRGEV